MLRDHKQSMMFMKYNRFTSSASVYIENNSDVSTLAGLHTKENKAIRKV